LPVPIVNALLSVRERISITEFGEASHVEFGGVPTQVSAIVPVKLPNGVKVTVYLVFCPALAICEVESTEIEKSVTSCEMFAEALPLKLPSPL